MRNFGKKSLDEIKERLAARGLIEAPVKDEESMGAESSDTEATEAESEEMPNDEEELAGGPEEREES